MDLIGNKNRGSRAPRLIPQLVCGLKKKGHADATIDSYVGWLKRYIRYHKMAHPLELGAGDIEDFLSQLAVEKRVSSSTQNQALNSLVFLYRHVFDRNKEDFGNFTRAKVSNQVPVVFEVEEIVALFDQLSGVYWLMALLIYGGGLRVRECHKLRIKDIDFINSRLLIRNAKGKKDRITLLSDRVKEPLKRHIEKVRELHQRDLERGLGKAPLPDALHRKYPNLNTEWAWQFVFPSKVIRKNKFTGLLCRHQMSESSFQKAFKVARHRANIEKHASCHNLRHTFAIHMLVAGYDVRMVQKLLGHNSLKTTMIYLQMALDYRGLKSPADLIPPLPEKESLEDISESSRTDQSGNYGTNNENKTNPVAKNKTCQPQGILKYLLDRLFKP